MTTELDFGTSQHFSADVPSVLQGQNTRARRFFYKNLSRSDGQEAINGQAMPSLRVLLDMVRWEWLCHGIAGRFHGDFHFENILWCERDKRFVFLDWRQDFGGDLYVGDIAIRN